VERDPIRAFVFKDGRDVASVTLAASIAWVHKRKAPGGFAGGL
jgi:hypothetical protein